MCRGAGFGIQGYFPDGPETQRMGLVPDVALRLTIAALRAERGELDNQNVELIAGSEAVRH